MVDQHFKQKSYSGRTRENFLMSEASFYMLCEELRPYLKRQTTKLGKPVSVETQVAVTLYYLADESRMRKYETHLV